MSYITNILTDIKNLVVELDTSGRLPQVPDDLASTTSYVKWNSTSQRYEAATIGSLSVAWGDITGTLTDQTDLVTAFSTYTGATSIVTLGTITSGTWHGSVIGSSYGGSGINNGGTFTWGSNNITFTTTSTTSLTLPTSGTLATQAYADSLVVGLLDDRGNYNASGNVYPSSGGSGTAGAILKGDLWTISVSGTLGGTLVTAGDVIRAIVDSPGQTSSNWAIGENNFGYVALNQAMSAGTVYVGNGFGIGTAVTLTGDVTVNDTGVTAIGSGKVTNSMLVNSSMTINGTSISLGGTATITAAASTLTGTTLASNVVSSSLTSVGTIVTGGWAASIIAGQYGGTGVANTGKTITISGNTTIGSSTHTVGFTTTANTSITLPTTGTLATLAGTETMSNKTFTGGITHAGATSGSTLLQASAAASGTLTLPPITGTIVAKPIQMFSPQLLQTTAGGTDMTSGTGYAIYTGVAQAAFTTAKVVFKPTTVTSPTYTEVAIYKGAFVASGNAGSLTKVAVDTTTWTTGTIMLTITLTNISQGDELWVVFAYSGGTVTCAGYSAERVSTGIGQSATSWRPSIASSTTSVTLEASTKLPIFTVYYS